MTPIIELRKVTELSGKVRFRIYVDGGCEESRCSEEEAKEVYAEYLENIEKEYPKTEVILTNEVTPTEKPF